MAMTCSFHNLHQPKESHGVQTATDFYSISTTSVIFALILSVTKSFKLLYLLSVFRRHEAIKEQQCSELSLETH